MYLRNNGRVGIRSNLISRADARPPGSPSCVKVTSAQQQTIIANVRHDHANVGRSAWKSMLRLDQGIVSLGGSTAFVEFRPRRKCFARPFSKRTSSVLLRSRRARYRPRNVPGVISPRSRYPSARRYDQARGAFKRSLAQFDSEQSVAFEGAGQEKAASFERREAEACVIRRIAAQDHGAIIARLRKLERALHQCGADAKLAMGRSRPRAGRAPARGRPRR